MRAQPELPASGMWFGAFIVASLLFAAFMGAQHLSSDGLWLDEWWSLYGAGAPIFRAESSIPAIWTRQAVEDPYNLPGFPWLLALWSAFAGWSELAGRLLPWFAGLLTIAIAARLGADAGGARVGAASALAASTSAWLHYYMHELRAFALIAMLTALLILLYRRAQRHSSRRLVCTCIAMTCAALVYLHYFAALPIAALGTWHLLQLRRPISRSWWLITAALAGGTLSLLPWGHVAFGAMQSMQSQQRVDVSPERLLQLTTGILTVFSTGTPVLFAFFATLGLAHKEARRYGLIAGILLLFILAAYSMFAVGEIRYAYALFPFLTLLAGFGIAALTQCGVPFVLIAALLLFSTIASASSPDLWNMMQRTPPQPFRDVAGAVAPLLSPDDRILYVLGEDADTRGVHEAPFRYYMDPLQVKSELVTLAHPTLEDIRADFSRGLGEARTVWVTRTSESGQETALLIDSIMQQTGYLACDGWHTTPPSAARPYARPLLHSDANVIHADARATVLANRITIWLWFGVPPVTPDDMYSVGIHVVDTEGALRAQTDFALPAEDVSCSLVTIPTGDLTRGEYTVQLVIYDWQTGVRTSFADRDGIRLENMSIGALTLSVPVLQSSP